MNAASARPRRRSYHFARSRAALLAVCALVGACSRQPETEAPTANAAPAASPATAAPAPATAEPLQTATPSRAPATEPGGKIELGEPPRLPPESE